ncbi:hypothetical protein [Pseudomonas syringae]|uniref:hypothetical protein n=1 Tax=Pseudomonas syringae TaxID=317 RepID=UPI001604BDC3|nr:hypothetical protein [Pseudomonas syringae]MDH4605563.1 hypothetical protein [Pseudomonas syringae pv. papulans]
MARFGSLVAKAHAFVPKAAELKIVLRKKMYYKEFHILKYLYKSCGYDYFWAGMVIAIGLALHQLRQVHAPESCDP